MPAIDGVVSLSAFSSWSDVFVDSMGLPEPFAAARAPAQVETWVREGDAHLVVAEGSFLRPWEDVEYTEVVLGFLGRHFGR